MHQEIHTENIGSRAQAPEVAQLFQRFEACADRATGVAYERFCDEVMPRFGPDLMVLTPTGDGDYAFSHYGREIIRYVGASRLRQRVSAMTGPVAAFTIACCDRALAEGRALYTVHRSRATVRVCLWERLLMPATAADGGRHLIVFSRPLQFHEELLHAVLDSSPSGIVALRAYRDAAGQLERLVVITANPKVVAMVGRCEDQVLDHEARAALPFLADPSIWARCLAVLQTRAPDQFDTGWQLGDRIIWLQLAVAPFGDGLVLTVSDITNLVTVNRALQSRAATLTREISRERASRAALSQEIGQRDERERELRRLAETDPLTALLNRRSFMEKAHAAIQDCDEAGSDLSLIIVDLDHFKAVNDNHGHPAGDAVIRAFADLLLGQVRTERDLVGRFGGEEFAMLLPRANLEAALRIALRVQEVLGARRLPVSETLALLVTASFGVATRQPGETLATLIERADRALYRAKNDGRSCIRFADDEGGVAA